MSMLGVSAMEDRAWDCAGVGASLACVAHCVATPFLLVLLPTLRLLERETHLVFALAILCIGLLAFVPGYRLHRRRQILGIGLAGFGILTAAALVPEGDLSETMETGLTIAGGAMLIAAHLRNIYFCRRCRACAKKSCAD